MKRALTRVRRRFLFAAASVLLIAVVQQAIDLNLSGREEVLHQFHALQNLLVRQEVHEAVSYLQACAADLHALAALPSVRHHDGARIPADVQAYYRSGDHPRPTAIEVVNEQGAVVASSPASAGTNDYAGSPLLKWATGEASRGQVFFCPSPRTTKDPKDSPSERQFLLATPLPPFTPDSPASSEASDGSGVLVMTVDLESVLTEHLALLSPKAAAHRVWMMDRDGTILLQSEHPEMARENIFRVRPECVQCHVSFDYAQRMLGQERGITEYQLRDQPRKLAAFAPMRFANASWLVVVNAPYTAVTSYARRSFGQVLLLLVMLALALTLVSALVHQSNVSRIRAEQEAQGWQEKHHLQELIQRAEARYRTLFEQSPDGVLMIDPQTTRPLEFSEAAHRQLGYSRSEFAGLRLCDYEAIETCSATQAHFARLLHDGQIRFETRHRTRQGESRDVEVIGRTLNLAGRTVFHCIYHDITERKRSEESLHRRSAQLEDLHRANLAIAAEMEPGILFETITASAVDLFQGTSGALLLPRQPQQALEWVATAGRGPAFADACREEVTKLAGRVWTTGSPLRVPGGDRPGDEATPSGSGCWGAGVVAPLRSGDACVGVLALFSDTPGWFSRDGEALLGLFTTQAAIAIKNADLLEQVRRDAAVKTTLLNEVNHRVKNNLMRLVEIVRLGYEHVPSSEIRLRAALQDLRNRLQGMAVVHTMLSTARWSPLPLSELVRQVVEAALHGASAHPVIRVSVDAPAETLVVPEQATAVALILNELATNSLKHALGNRAEARVEVHVHVEDLVQGRPLIRLEYRDDGPGWPEAVLRGRIDTLGLSLIQATVRSPLRGGLTLSNRSGAVAELAFHLALPA